MRLVKSAGRNEKAVAFFRVSSEDQRDGHSLDAQKKLAESYAKSSGLLLIKAFSGVESASKEDDRKRFFEMIEFVKTNGIKHIVFDKVDRAVRGFKSAVIVEEMIDDYGVKFHFTRESLEIDAGSPPSQKMRFYLSTILAKYYVDNLKVEIKKGLNEREEEGYWNHKAPLGYRNVEVSKRKVVAVDPVEGPAVRMVFEQYATGNFSLPMLIEKYNVKTGQQRTWKVLEKVLSNPFYYGIMRTKDRTRPGKHEALIPKDLWVACQKIRGIRAAQHAKNDIKRAVQKPFMGMIHCFDCHARITGETVHKSNGKTYIYYRCANNKCVRHSKRVKQEDIHLQLNEAFKPFECFTEKTVGMFIEQVKISMDHLNAYTDQSIQRLRKEVAETKEKMMRLGELLAARKIPQAEHDDWIALAREKISQHNIEIAASCHADAKTFDQGLKIIQLLTKVSDYQNMDMDLMKKAELAKILLSNVLLKRETLHWNYVSPLDDLIVLVQGRDWWRLGGSNS